jgi:hypothetical protein
MKMRRFKMTFVASGLLLSAAALLSWGVLRSMSKPEKIAPMTVATKTALERKLGVGLPADCIALTESDGGFDPAEYYEYVLQSKSGFVFDRQINKLENLPIDSIVDVLKSRNVIQGRAHPLRTWKMSWAVGTYRVNADVLVTDEGQLLWIRRSRH